MSPVLIPALTGLAAMILWLFAVMPLWRFRRGGATALAAAAVILALAVGLSSLPTALAGEAIRAGFDLPGGARFSLRLDALALMFLTPMLVSALAVVVIAGRVFERETTVRRFQPVLLAVLTALVIVILADPVWLVMTAWMVAAVLSFVLLWRCGDLRADIGCALPFLLRGLAAAAFLFTGLSQLSTLAGSGDMTMISHSGREIAAGGQNVIPAILILTGAVIGVGSFPFGPGRRRVLFAPMPALAFLLPAGPGLAALFLLTRLAPAAAGIGVMPGIGAGQVPDQPFWGATLMALAALALILGGSSALGRRGLPGLSEALISAQMAAGLWLAGTGAAGAVGILVIAMVPAGTALFLCAGLIRRETGSLHLAAAGGLVNRMPLTALLIALALLSLAGISPFIGWHALSVTFDALGGGGSRAAALATTGAGGAGIGQGLSGAAALLSQIALPEIILISGYALIFAALLQAARLARTDAAPPEADPALLVRDPRPILLAVPAALVALLLLGGIFPDLLRHLASVAGLRIESGIAAQTGRAIRLWPGSDVAVPWAWLASVGFGFLIHGLRRHPPHIAENIGEDAG